MKPQGILILISLTVCISILILPALANTAPSVGVKEGDWMEYNISITGTGTPPPTHDVRWMRMQVLEIEGTAFSVNVIARYANGTVGSAIWRYNFTEGNLGGWTIIPANLSAGDTFYDSAMHNHKPVNVTIQSQEEKTVLGATRTITYGNDSLRHKQWDKTTGMFVGSTENIRNVTNKDGWYIENLTVATQAIATNMWNPQSSPTPQLSQTAVYPLVAAMAVAIVFFSLLIIAVRTKKLTISSSLGQKITALGVLVVILLAVGAVASIPMNQNQLPLSFREINLIMQTFWTSLLLASMWFRRRGNYFMHEILMIVVVAATLVSFSLVLVMSPPGGSDMQEYFAAPLNVAVFFAHAVFSLPAIFFGVWLVVLWRPSLPTYAEKSRRMAQLTLVFWVLSYIAGILDYLVLRAAVFG